MHLGRNLNLCWGGRLLGETALTGVCLQCASAALNPKSAPNWKTCPQGFGLDSRFEAKYTKGDKQARIK